MKKADFILIAVVLVVALVLVVFLYGFNGGSGKYVQVEIDGEVVETISLEEDCQKEYETANGGTNTLVVENGKATITQANCPDEICKRHMAISRAGESIICLPHKLVITVVGNLDDTEIDAVA